MTLTPEQLTAIRERCNAATPGPWYTVDLPWRAPGCGTYVVAGNPDPHVGRAVLDAIDIDEWNAEHDVPDYSQSDADLEFAAAARTDVPLLLAEIDRLTAELAEASVRTHSLAERLLESQSAVAAARAHCVDLADRVARQSELLSQRAERPA